MSKIRIQRFSKAWLIKTMIYFIIAIIAIIILWGYYEQNEDEFLGDLLILPVFLFITEIIKLIRYIIYRITLKAGGVTVINAKNQSKQKFTQEEINNYWNSQR